MRAASASDLRAALAERRFMQECLLDDVRPRQFGFGLDLIFNYIWSEAGSVRDDIGEWPVPVRFKLQGVHRIEFTGGLTQAMLNDSDQVNWGLTEVSTVQPLESKESLGISVRWEGARRLDTQFETFEVIGPIYDPAAAPRT